MGNLMNDLFDSKVLVVDDMPGNIDILDDMLDYDVSVALDGEEALDSIRRMHPDLILLDITIPSIDGYQMDAMFKEGETTKHISFILRHHSERGVGRREGASAGSGRLYHQTVSSRTGQGPYSEPSGAEPIPQQTEGAGGGTHSGAGFDPGNDHAQHGDSGGDQGQRNRRTYPAHSGICRSAGPLFEPYFQMCVNETLKIPKGEKI